MLHAATNWMAENWRFGWAGWWVATLILVNERIREWMLARRRRRVGPDVIIFTVKCSEPGCPWSRFDRVPNGKPWRCDKHNLIDAAREDATKAALFVKFANAAAAAATASEG